MIDESRQIGTSVTCITAWIAATRSAGSSTAGMPALTSSIWAPAAAWASASARTRSITPSFISAARTLRPVGLIRSPMITKGRSPEMTTSRPREETWVSNELTLSQRLVDLHHGLLQCLGARRALTSIAYQLLRHPGRHRGVGRVAVGADVLRVLQGDRCAPDGYVHLVAQARLRKGLDVGLEHRHRGRQERGEADHVGLVLLDCRDELLGRRVHAEVEDLEPGALEHDHAQVLADVVDVALHGADDIAPYRLCAGLRDERAQDHQRALHRAGGDQHLGDEEVAFLEAAADLLQGGDQGLEQDVHRVHAQGQGFLGQGFDLRRVAVERVLEKLGADLFLAAHPAHRTCPTRCAQRIMLRYEQRDRGPGGRAGDRDPGRAGSGRIPNRGRDRARAPRASLDGAPAAGHPRAPRARSSRRTARRGDSEGWRGRTRSSRSASTRSRPPSMAWTARSSRRWTYRDRPIAFATVPIWTG